VAKVSDRYKVMGEAMKDLHLIFIRVDLRLAPYREFRKYRVRGLLSKDRRFEVNVADGELEIVSYTN